MIKRMPKAFILLGSGSGKGRPASDGKQIKSIAIPRVEAVEYDED